MESVDEFLVVERSYSDDESMLSVGLANIGAVVPDVEANKSKVLRAATLFKERGVNVAVFPEFCLSGYFWEDEQRCRAYMEQAVTEEHTGWIEGSLRPLLDDEFKAIVLNNLTKGPEGKFFNTTFVVARDHDYLVPENTYYKIFLPGIEKTYTESGQDDRLVVESVYGRFGFVTCYDYLFSDLLREYAILDRVDAIVVIASWRAAATRDYPAMSQRTDLYYGHLWDTVLAAFSATNQVWTIACNAVGRHGVTGVPFWGGSGIWTPSGLPLIQGSHFNEELLIVHNLDINGARETERDDFDYAFDFSAVYQPLESSRSFTRMID